MTAQPLDAAACSAVDSTGQFGETLGLAEHLRDAVWRVDSAGIAPVDAQGGLIVAGMGGSSVGGPLAERAREDGVPVVPLPGGFQPRAAVGYSLVTALEAAALCGAAPSVRDDVAAAAALARELAGEWGPDAAEDSEAKRLARALVGSIPVITGEGLTASVAYRWKTQINENAELPAFASKLPEHDHNEIVGWAGAEQRLGAIFLHDPESDPKAARRKPGAPGVAAGGARGVARRP